MNAATSEPTNISPSPIPTTSGVERRAATMVPGSSALANTRVKWPSSRRSTASTEAGKSPAVSPWWYAWATRCTATSVSVSLANSTPAVFQLVAQRREVLDDAVVDDGDLAGGVAVRVRIAVGGAAVGRPAGVAQAGAAGQRIRRHLGHRGLEVGQPTGATTHSEFAVTVDQGESRRSRSRGTPSGAARP